MHTSIRHTAGIICLTALFLGACSQESGNQMQGMTPEVGVVELTPTKVVLTSELVGRTVSSLQAEVRPQVRGLIRTREFIEGGEVTQGQILYQIEPESYKAISDNAKAALVKAEANLEVTRLKARRVVELRKTNAVSQQDSDDAQAAYLQAQAEVSAARAALDTANINLNRTRITAPISGRISKSSVTVGALVTADQPAPLATIHTMDPMYVDVTQSAQSLLTLRRTMSEQAEAARPLFLVLPDGTRYQHSGKLRFADVGVNETTGTVTLRADFPNPEQELLPGLYVRVILTEGENDQALLVPQRSILRDNRGNPLVMVVTPEGIAERRPITIGKDFGENWIVLSGLKPGEKVIVEGIQKVRPGGPVKPVPYVGAPSDATKPLPAESTKAAPGQPTKVAPSGGGKPADAKSGS